MRNEQNRPLVDRSRVRDIGIEMSELFRFSPVRRNAPQVHLTRGWPTPHKVDPAPILRPDLKVIVQSRLAFQDLTFTGAVVVRHKRGVARFPRVIHQPGAIGRPGNLGSMFIQKIVRRSAHQRPQPEPPAFRSAAPHLRSVARESDSTKGRARVSDPALGKVREAATVGLNQPDVERAAPVGDEGDEFPVRGDGRVRFGSFEVGEPRELRIGKRILYCRPAAK